MYYMMTIFNAFNIGFLDVAILALHKYIKGTGLSEAQIFSLAAQSVISVFLLVTVEIMETHRSHKRKHER